MIELFPTPVNLISLKRYISFINAIKSQTITGNKEIHHILPRSMNGKDENYNLISLTPRQHFIAHWMLWKAYKTPNVTYAFWSMSKQNNQNQHRYKKINSKTYELLKQDRKVAIATSNRNRWKNKEWAKKFNEKNILSHNTPEYKDYASKKMSSLNEIYKEQFSKNAKVRWSDPDFKEKTSKKIKESLASTRKPIEVNGVIFSSCEDVCKVFNICPSAVRRRIKSTTEQFKGWKYI